MLCFNCGKQTGNPYPLCQKCTPFLLNRDSVCVKCGIPTTRFIKICSSCREIKSANQSNYSFFIYRGLSRALLNLYKFNKEHTLAKFYSAYLVDYIYSNFTNPIICPVPTSILKRKIKNGYHLDPLIKELKKSGIYSKNILKKKFGKTQKKLGKYKRLTNSINSFSVIKNSEDRNRPIVLIDDVYTTGATIENCAKVLSTNGFKRIYSLTLCRD